MKKKTKKAIGVGAASAAAFAAGVLLYAAPAYADEACDCEPGKHTEDCTCGCADAAKVLEEAENNKLAAEKDVKSATDAEKKAKDACDEAAAAEKAAETAENEAEAAYNDAVAAEEAAIKADKKKAEDAEAAALDAQNQAVVKEGQAELAAKEAKEASDAAKTELDTAIGYRDGTLPIENTDEYKTAQEKQTALDTAKADKDEANDTLDAAKADADEKTTALDAATKDNDEKQQTLSDKQTKADAAQKAADNAKAEHDADANALNTATQEKDAAEKDVSDKTAAKEAADKAQTEKDAAYQATKDEEAKAQATYDEKFEKFAEGAFGFYQYIIDNGTEEWKIEDAKSALRFLESGRNADRTNKGSLTDATALDNMLEAVQRVREANELRTNEGFGAAALNITNFLMANAQSNVNYHMSERSISKHLPIGEYNAENISSYSNPFDGWYTVEKADFEAGSRDYYGDKGQPQIGHYVNLTEREIKETSGYDLKFFTTGFAVNTTSGKYSLQVFAALKGGYTVNEYENLLKEYYNTVDPAQEKAALDKAKENSAKALSEKEAADKAARDAATALTSAQNTQAEKAKALETAIAKEKASSDALAVAQTALSAAEKELTEAKTAADASAKALETATKANTEAQATLDAAQSNYDTKQAAYEKAFDEDEVADKALAELSNVAPRQEAYDKAEAIAKEAATALEQAKADTEAARNAYDEAKRALDVANMRVASDAEAVKDAYEALQSAKKDHEDKAKSAASALDMYEKSKTDTIKAQDALKAAEDKLAAAKLALEAAEKECESHIAKDVTVSINFRTKDGELANAVHTEVYIDGKYAENGAFGLPAAKIKTDSEIKIHFLGQTGGHDKVKMAEIGEKDHSSAYFLKFINDPAEESGKGTLKAVLLNDKGEILSGDWFKIAGAKLETGEVELIFLMEKVEGGSIVIDHEDTIVQPTKPVKPVIKPVVKESQATPSVISAKAGTGTKTVTTAANTGDNSYAQLAAYNVLAAAALAGMGIAVKRRKRSDR